MLISAFVRQIRQRDCAPVELVVGSHHNLCVLNPTAPQWVVNVTAVAGE